MLAARLLDVLLVLILFVYLVVGYRDGLARILGALIGIALGGVVVFFGVPLLVPLIPEPFWRVVATIVATVLVLVAGHSAGYAAGRAIGKHVRSRRPLAVIDRVAGSVVGVVVSALIASLVLSGLGALGAPVISQAATQSWVAAGIAQVTPAPVQAGLARLRSLVLENGLPRINEALGGITNSPGAPPALSSGTLQTASRSVVRINGTAYACGQNQSGSGFVVARDRIITNAHVVAGVDQPVVEAPDGQSVQARVVYFDPRGDLAVLATSGLRTDPLRLSDPMTVGENGVVDGYPYGGPFTSGGAKVLALSTENVSDIYDSSRSPREVYTLAAQVRPGNSGGPLLTPDGEVAGVVFAENADDDQLGYAMSDASLAPVARQAPGLGSAVPSGHCTRD